MIEAVVFDLDDTLYPEIDYCRSGLRAVAEFLSAETNRETAEIFAVLWQQFEHGDRRRIFDNGLAQLGLDNGSRAVRRLVRLYRQHRPRLRLPRVSRRVLRELDGRYRLAVLTDGYLPAQRLKVHALGLDRLVGPVLYTEQLGRRYWKPSPEGFRRLAGLLAVPPAGLVYVGDNPAKDFLAPNELGWTTVQVAPAQALHPQEPPSPAHQARHRIEGLAQLPALLTSLAGG